MSGIFASPNTPYFSVAECYVNSDLLEDALRNLAEKNEMLLGQSTEKDGCFKNAKAAELVFNICKKLDTPTEVRFVAVEIFDEFMQKHISELQEIIANSSSSEKKQDWSAVEDRLKDQLPLRAVTCVQLASKLVSHYRAITPSKVRRFLSACGLQCSTSTVVRSELRVLKTLDFRLTSISPLTHVEMLLEVLRRNCPGLQANLVHGVSVQLLDVVYMQRDSIYHLLSRATDMFLDPKLANDQFLLSTCIVVAAAYILDSDSSDSFVEQMSLITCIKEADIIIFSTILVQVALELF